MSFPLDCRIYKVRELMLMLYKLLQLLQVLNLGDVHALKHIWSWRSIPRLLFINL